MQVLQVLDVLAFSVDYKLDGATEQQIGLDQNMAFGRAFHEGGDI